MLMDVEYVMSLLSVLLSVITLTFLIIDFVLWVFPTRADIKRIETKLDRIEGSLNRSKQ